MDPEEMFLVDKLRAELLAISNLYEIKKLCLYTLVMCNFLNQ